MASSPQYATLAANTVTTIDLTAAIGAGKGPTAVRVTTDGFSQARVYFTADGTTPTIDATGTSCLLGGQAGYRRATCTVDGFGKFLVKLVSAGTPWVMVEVDQ